MTKASWRYAILAALMMVVVVYCALGVLMAIDLDLPRRAGEFWEIAFVVSLIVAVALAVVAWRRRRT
jgi:hypothetical protein